jgi:hypothetical protein
LVSNALTSGLHWLSFGVTPEAIFVFTKVPQQSFRHILPLHFGNFIDFSVFVEFIFEG